MARGAFSGTQRIVQNLPISGLADMAVHVWARLDTSQSANNRIMECGDGTHGVGLAFQSAGTTLQVVDSGIAWRGSGFAMAGGAWTAIGLARSGSGNWQLFKDGVNIENPTASPAALSGFLYWGNDATNTFSFNGYLGPCSVWANALTAAEFARLALGASPLTIQPSQLKSHISMYGAVGAAGDEIDYGPFQFAGFQGGSPGVPAISQPALRSPFPPQ